MKHRSVFFVFTMLFFCSSLVFGAGSFFETADQAKETGQAVKSQDSIPTDTDAALEEGEEPGKSEVDKDREKDSPADHDNGTGNDDKVAKDKDKDKNVIDPENPADNDEFDPKGELNPGKMGNCSDQDLVRIIGNTHKINVKGWQYGHNVMTSGFGWSYSHLFEIYRTLYVLPRFFITGGLNIHWGGCGNSCRSICHLQGNSIFFCHYAPMRKGLLSALFMREMGRFLFRSREFTHLRAQWIKMFWLNERIIKIKPPFKFICKTPDEDFGESVKSYWCCGDWFHSRDKARYEFVHRLVMKGKKVTWSNAGCGCAESDEAARTFPNQPVATGSVKVGGGDHGASGKADLNDKNKVDNANKANNNVKTTTAVIKTTVPAVKPVVKTPVKQPVQPAKPVVKTPVKQPVQPAKPVAIPANNSAKNTVSNGGDHGASGKTDLNDKNKVNNAATANNSSAKTTGSKKK